MVNREKEEYWILQVSKPEPKRKMWLLTSFNQKLHHRTFLRHSHTRACGLVPGEGTQSALLLCPFDMVHVVCNIGQDCVDRRQHENRPMLCRHRHYHKGVTTMQVTPHNNECIVPGSMTLAMQIMLNCGSANHVVLTQHQTAGFVAKFSADCRSSRPLCLR